MIGAEIPCGICRERQPRLGRMCDFCRLQKHKATIDAHLEGLKYLSANLSREDKQRVVKMLIGLMTDMERVARSLEEQPQAKQRRTEA